MEQNMNDLINAAKLKLEAQQKQNELPQEDIYANIRDDDYSDEFYSDISRTNNQQQNIEYEIDYEPEAEEEYLIDHNDSPLFEGGPGISQLDLWKKQYTKEKIFHTQILDKHFVFRTLNRFEYKQIVAIENIDALYREEIICHTCVLWPFNYDFKKMAAEDSGYPSTLAQIIMENSGFTKEYGIEVL